MRFMYVSSERARAYHEGIGSKKTQAVTSGIVGPAA